MSRYFFDVEDGHRLIDPAGLDCRNDEDALEKGTAIAQQIALDAPNSAGRHVEVVDEEKRKVGKVPVRAPSAL
jgi:hypothetical protein